MKDATKERKELLASIAYHYGFESQCRQCMEEMAELTKEICKYFRAADEKDEVAARHALFNIACEIADVDIMIQQLKLLSYTDHIEKEVDQKIERQIKRIKAGKALT